MGGEKVTVFASSAVDRVFEPRSGQTKDYSIGICYISANHTALKRKSKYCWLVIRMKCPSMASYLSADCCFSEPSL